MAIPTIPPRTAGAQRRRALRLTPAAAPSLSSAPTGSIRRRKRIEADEIYARMVVLEGPRGMIVLNAAAGLTGEPFIAITDAECNSRISIGMEQAADGRQNPRIVLRDANERDLLRIEIKPSTKGGRSK